MPGFPDPWKAPANAPLAYGGDLSAERLIDAYSQGIFPWYSDGEPIYWWCPNPRMVLPPDEFHEPHGLKRILKDPTWTVTSDQAFKKVIEACASQSRPGQKGTWITPEMISAYCQLHTKGYAHSVECWRKGKLAGGLYGVSLGRMFFGESMFHYATNASKVAFRYLAKHLAKWEFVLIDCQIYTSHLAQFGARPITRNQFLELVTKAVKDPIQPGKWNFNYRGSN